MMRINNLSREAKTTAITLVALLVLSGILSLFSFTILESLRIVFGSVYILFLPGFLLTWIFFPRRGHGQEIDWLERIALAFALSIALVPLAVFYLNLIGIKISALSTFLIVLVILIIESVIIYLKRNRRQSFYTPH